VGGFSRQEIERAFAHYCELRERSSASGDWTIWAAQFTEDARYLEHAYGAFEGRRAIEDWIVGVMAPFPHMTFPNDWSIVDAERGWVVFQCQNRLEHPTEPGGPPFQFPTWSLLHYAGDLRWSYEEDVYNPKRAADTIQAWIRAGGRFRAPERVKMKDL
jgi:SnoaL-like domain